MEKSGKFPSIEESSKFPSINEFGKFPLMEGCYLTPTQIDPNLNFAEEGIKNVNTHRRGFSLSRTERNDLS